LAVKVDFIFREDKKANDGSHSQVVTKLETSKIKGNDEKERKESFLAHTEIFHEDMQGNVGNVLFPENNSVPSSSTVTESFQEYGAREEMAIVEKTLFIKPPSQMNVSSNDSKMSYDCTTIEAESLQKHLSALPESIDGFVKLDAIGPDDFHQNIDNQPTAAYENTTSINHVNEDIGTSILGIPEMKAGQTVAETGPLSKEKAIVTGEPLLSKYNAESAIGFEPPFSTGAENVVETMAITEDSKVSSAYDVNKRETSSDYDSIKQETIRKDEVDLDYRSQYHKKKQ
jgi:hypothetical protein